MGSVHYPSTTVKQHGEHKWLKICWKDNRHRNQVSYMEKVGSDHVVFNDCVIPTRHVQLIVSMLHGKIEHMETVDLPHFCKR